MKKFEKPPFAQKKIALAFTAGVHILAIVGLLYVGMNQPLKPPKPLETVLIRPEDLVPEPIPQKPVPAEVEEAETSHTQVAEQIMQTADPVAAAPIIPVPVPTPAPSASQLNATKAAEQAKLAEQQAAKEAARLEAQNKAAEAARVKAQAEADDFPLNVH